jgi:hypothetical protein
VYDKHWNPVGLNEICLVKANLEEKEYETWREITVRESTLNYTSLVHKNDVFCGEKTKSASHFFFVFALNASHFFFVFALNVFIQTFGV